MANANSTECIATAQRTIMGAVDGLHSLWALLEKSMDNSTEWAAVSLACELLPVIGGKLDAAIAAISGNPTGYFDGILDSRGITVSAPSEVNHG